VTGQPCSKYNSITCDDEDHRVHGVEEGGDVCILAVAATDRVPGDHRREYHDKTKITKAQATNPDEEEVDPHLVLRNANAEGNLSEHKKIINPPT